MRIGSLFSGYGGLDLAAVAVMDAAPAWFCEVDPTPARILAHEPAIRRWEHLTRPAPAPTEASANGGQRMSPAFAEWMMGLPTGWVTEVPGVNRNGQLKALGNGVIPQQAGEALRRLLAHTTEDRAVKKR